MKTKMLNGRAELTLATINLFGAFSPYIPEIIQDYTAKSVFCYRHKGFAIRETEEGLCYYFPLHIERISMITPNDILHDVSPDAFGILMTLHCYEMCIQSDVQGLSNNAKNVALEHIEVLKKKREVLMQLALRMLSPDDILMFVK